MKSLFRPWSLACALALVASVGCARNASMVRGQTPVPGEAAMMDAGGMLIPPSPAPIAGGQPILPTAGVLPGETNQPPAAAGGPVGVMPAVPGGTGNGPLIGSAPGYGQGTRHHVFHDFRTVPRVAGQNYGYDGGYYTGPGGYYVDQPLIPNGGAAGAGASGCPECQYGNACPTNGCRRCGLGCKSCPHHVNTYQHNWPRNLVYPDPSAPPAVVQYPYYTLRGPTDFFMK